MICHMASSIDGKIDGSALRNVMRPGEYESLPSKLGGDAWICGRTTMQQHFADAKPFVSTTNSPAGAPSIHVARRAESYAISVDTLGTPPLTKNEVDGDHIICVLSERVSTDYLAMLRDNGVFMS
jgi:2,5-diamino-6-(ribosylamino)-4(3H)-pyrimidinone 5'-phosphate reductase